MTPICIHGFDRPELTCRPCRERIALGHPLLLEHRVRAPKFVDEPPARHIEVVDDAALHRGRAPTVEEIREVDEGNGTLAERAVDERSAECGECGERKDLTEEFFYLALRTRIGYSISKCKVCRHKHEAAYRKDRSEKRAKKYTTLPAKETEVTTVRKAVETVSGQVLGERVLRDLQCMMDLKVAEVRRIHGVMLSVRQLYGLTVEIPMPRLVG